MNTSPINPLRQASGVAETAPVRAASRVSGRESAPAQDLPTVAVAALDTDGAQPIDHDRVTLIRKAIESGRYPIVPAKIADAMIAAGLFLRTSR